MAISRLPISRSAARHTSHRDRSQRWGLVLGSIAVTATTVVTLLGQGNPALAGDPFRDSNPMPIGDNTEAAFQAMFQESNYAKAAELLEQAQATEPNEPLIYPMLALLAQYEKDYAAMPGYAEQTREAAAAIADSQPLRSNLYSAVAEFVEGAYILSDAGDGPVRGLGKAFGKLRSFNASMAAARKIDQDDPELNLLEGFTDMYASAYLPLTSTDAAVAKLQKAGPSYLANWLTGLGYRILDEPDKGIAAIDSGLSAQPNHAEMNYLKAQLEMKKAKKDASRLTVAQKHFDIALAQSEVLPKRLVGQIMRERCINQEKLDGQERSCSGFMKQAIKDSGSSPWGPAKLPQL